MEIVLLDNSARDIFTKAAHDIYRAYPLYRGTEKSIEHLLLSKQCAFNSHAK
ncbi:MAG: hypothetical protein BWY70_01385 [Bacteroidetes bacterium ADurb.Bin408]|nr:MAG: hypothetical protein BWY70_01385 [Bacteroidetes bacterium ADurb.Bin408]